ncbi:hypothetical protein IMCC1989_221 [gamma proteobacterium IMCC1989]|nr:hypothetical protein IMCC1989_221 [gamma proteobacterium IMCC1989]
MCNKQPVLAASRMTFPVFGGISGSNRTILQRGMMCCSLIFGLIRKDK